MTSLVLDASGAMRLVVGGPGREAIEAAVAQADQIVTGTLFPAEVGNALWRHVRAGDLDLPTAAQALQTALALSDQSLPLSESITAEALREAVRHDHPVHDLIYIVTARRCGADTIATADRRLASLARRAGFQTVGADPAGRD
jgi:predicted nucleic acid-binding protein